MPFFFFLNASKHNWLCMQLLVHFSNSCVWISLFSAAFPFDKLHSLKQAQFSLHINLPIFTVKMAANWSQHNFFYDICPMPESPFTANIASENRNSFHAGPRAKWFWILCTFHHLDRLSEFQAAPLGRIPFRNCLFFFQSKGNMKLAQSIGYLKDP